MKFAAVRAVLSAALLAHLPSRTISEVVRVASVSFTPVKWDKGANMKTIEQIAAGVIPGPPPPHLHKKNPYRTSQTIHRSHTHARANVPLFCRWILCCVAILIVGR